MRRLPLGACTATSTKTDGGGPFRVRGCSGAVGVDVGVDLGGVVAGRLFEAVCVGVGVDAGGVLLRWLVVGDGLERDVPPVLGVV